MKVVPILLCAGLVFLMFYEKPSVSTHAAAEPMPSQEAQLLEQLVENTQQLSSALVGIQREISTSQDKTTEELNALKSELVKVPRYPSVSSTSSGGSTGSAVSSGGSTGSVVSSGGSTGSTGSTVRSVIGKVLTPVKSLASLAQLRAQHNAAHGGGNWTWPGPQTAEGLAQHLALEHPAYLPPQMANSVEYQPGPAYVSPSPTPALPMLLQLPQCPGGVCPTRPRWGGDDGRVLTPFR